MNRIGQVARSREGRAATGAATAVALAAITAHKLRGGDGDDDAPSGPSRAYRLRPREPAGFGLRRVARGRVENALELLRDPDADPVEAVHETRKEMKKLRSALRLVRPVLGEEVYGRENARYRDAAQLLSGVRDAQVMAETVDGLAECFPDEPPPGGWQAARDALAADDEVADLVALRERAAKAIEPGRQALAGLALPGQGGAVFEPGLRDAYARGRKRFREAQAEPTEERMHEWRKRSKDLWYHLRLLHDAWPPVLGPLSDEAHALSERLGDDHDLAVLRARLADAPLEPAQRSHLEQLIGRRRAQLQGEACAFGERLYAERPKAFARRIASYWDAARA